MNNSWRLYPHNKGFSFLEHCITLMVFSMILPILLTFILLTFSMLSSGYHQLLTYSEGMLIHHIIQEDFIGSRFISVSESEFQLIKGQDVITYVIEEEHLIRKNKTNRTLTQYLTMNSFTISTSNSCITLHYHELPSDILCL